jgi:3'-phosphoadenosine 5'-phosphosulfate sulfotransferase (PAPS reductase)/FAD synthetase
MASMQEALDSLSNKNIRHIVSVSGGKDSTALAIYMKQKYPDIPAEYVFCDTDCELPETLEYLTRLESLLGADVVRLTALDNPALNVKKKPGRNSFDMYLNELYGGFLPNPRSRWCTRVLKIEPFERFVGDSHVFSYIGIRGDEDREGYQSKKPPVISQRPNILPVYPFKDDEMGLEDIKLILEESGIGLPGYYKWRSRSGCYFCFYQQVGEWQNLKDVHPDLFEKAMKYERTSDGDRGYTWVDGRPLLRIAELPEREEIPAPDLAEGCAVCHL